MARARKAIDMVVPVAVPAGVDDPGAMTSPGDGDTDAHVPPSFDEVATELVRGLAPVIVSEMDSDGRTTAISGALLDRLGYPEEWFLGKTISDISDDSTTRDVVDRVLAGEEVRTTVSLNRRPWLVWMRPVRAADGTVEGAVSVMTYAEDSRAQQELVAQEHLNRQFEAVIELSQDFIAIVDLDRRITYLNRAGREMVGLTEQDEVIGMSSDDLLPPDGVQRTRDEEARFLTEGHWQGVSSLRHVRTGEVIPVSAQTFLVSRSLDGRPLAVASVRRDLRAEQAAKRVITLRIQEQRALAELGRQAVSLPLAALLVEGVELVAARYRSMVAGVMQRTDDGTAGWSPALGRSGSTCASRPSRTRSPAAPCSRTSRCTPRTWSPMPASRTRTHRAVRGSQRAVLPDPGGRRPLGRGGRLRLRGAPVERRRPRLPGVGDGRDRGRRTPRRPGVAAPAPGAARPADRAAQPGAGHGPGRHRAGAVRAARLDAGGADARRRRLQVRQRRARAPRRRRAAHRAGPAPRGGGARGGHRRAAGRRRVRGGLRGRRERGRGRVRRRGAAGGLRGRPPGGRPPAERVRVRRGRTRGGRRGHHDRDARRGRHRDVPRQARPARHLPDLRRGDAR